MGEFVPQSYPYYHLHQKEDFTFLRLVAFGQECTGMVLKWWMLKWTTCNQRSEHCSALAHANILQASRRKICITLRVAKCHGSQRFIHTKQALQQQIWAQLTPSKPEIMPGDLKKYALGNYIFEKNAFLANTLLENPFLKDTFGKYTFRNTLSENTLLIWHLATLTKPYQFNPNSKPNPTRTIPQHTLYYSACTG